MNEPNHQSASESDANFSGKTDLIKNKSKTKPKTTKRQVLGRIEGSVLAVLVAFGGGSALSQFPSSGTQPATPVVAQLATPVVTPVANTGSKNNLPEASSGFIVNSPVVSGPVVSPPSSGSSLLAAPKPTSVPAVSAPKATTGKSAAPILNTNTANIISKPTPITGRAAVSNNQTAAGGIDQSARGGARNGEVNPAQAHR